jgi:hypothetical protein
VELKKINGSGFRSDTQAESEVEFGRLGSILSG